MCKSWIKTRFLLIQLQSSGGVLHQHIQYSMFQGYFDSPLEETLTCNINPAIILALSKTFPPQIKSPRDVNQICQGCQHMGYKNGGQYELWAKQQWAARQSVLLGSQWQGLRGGVNNGIWYAKQIAQGQKSKQERSSKMAYERERVLSGYVHCSRTPVVYWRHK